MFHYYSFGILTIITFVCCLVTSYFAAAKLTLTSRKTDQHWIHEGYASRYGGIVICVALCGCIAWKLESPASPSDLIFFCSLMFFLIGFVEDFGLELSQKIKLILGIGASAVTLQIVEVGLTSTNLFIIDHYLLQNEFMVFAVSTLITGTLIQAYNLVDGLNGLCSGISICALALVSHLAFTYDIDHIREFTTITIFIVAGFWLSNVLTGRVFLGDSGAYIIGSIVCFSSLYTAEKIESVTPWCFLLANTYPVYDVTSSFSRRVLSNSGSLIPDTQHFHHLLHQRVKKRLNQSALLRTCPPFVSNSVSAQLIVTIHIVLIFIAYRFHEDAATCATVFALTFTGFLVAHIFLKKSDTV